MEVELFVNQLQNIATQVEQDMGVILREAAHVMVADVKHRVTFEGVNKNGSGFTPYSTKPMLVSPKSFQTVKGFNRFTKVSKGAKGLANKRGVKFSQQYEWRTIIVGGVARRLMVLPGGYKQFRELHGHPTQKKIFYWNGTMMNSIKIGRAHV